MDIFLDDSRCREGLFPFTLTRHAADIRIGIYTIKEKWQLLTGANIFSSEDNIPPSALTINANIIPTNDNIDTLVKAAYDKIAVMETEEIRILQHPWQIFQYNDWALRHDFKITSEGRQSGAFSDTNTYINPSNIFIEEGADVQYSILNAVAGPIYIGKNTVVMEGNMIRGPFALCESATLKMGGKIYAATTIGPHCVAAGEIKNAVMFGFSNKAHDGYLGDSVIGEWCNLGAGTSNSNVKNTGGSVQYFLNNNMEFTSAGNKGGLLMGDYSRAAINTSFNTGTVVGVCCNIFGDVSSRKYLADFSWGNDRYIFDKAIRDIDVWKKMKGNSVNEKEIEMLRKIYESQ
ncbi:putative sugar nucleotidyl transferase [Ferruginibacter sp. HRS2-29]|uniref:putative sugar nucleotidyl transferase n=1 Tax=Ferruginibacter sp. HRS2-29 TaxID=2487334 RepID=UPI0020CE35F2|nr:putative sugar nucleotidyl transferase [Ferruginibacter sp. HRS2-29]MCP9751444.1 glucose-1-phosphate thymidylyltransferase [Ferruginibacter sp. HRS2-29]